ncbi:MAG: HAD-IA family hydrolase [Cytophagales bacterium]|nr:HAD-IA family hydrolase [Cytophagales bacterium]MDW8384612.1 HAD-IA family hydrolase [Flammeovirgaceae bacterium]
MITIHPKAQALIFDIDGTLADTMPTHYQAWYFTATQHGLHFPEELFYKWAGMPTHKIVEIINQLHGTNFSEEYLTAYKERKYQEIQQEIRPIEPIIKIAHLHFGKLPMSCGTGNYKKVAYEILDKLGIKHYFTAIISADDVLRPKPDPETFLRCAEAMEIAPEFCQVFEDGEPGLEAARQAGMIVTDVRPFIGRKY